MRSISCRTILRTSSWIPAASGKHHLERDGITRRIESRYILIGTMNPEEGELRPQLSDRFAHGIVIQDDFTAEQRVEVVRRRIQFDDDPDGFMEMHAASLADLAERLTKARTLVKSVTVSEEQRLEIANQARELQVEGLRAELAVVRTARCAAAWENRSKIEQRDLDEAWRMCLGHRRPENRPPAPAPPAPSPGQRFNPPLLNAYFRRRLSILCQIQSDCLRLSPRLINRCEIGLRMSLFLYEAEKQGEPPRQSRTGASTGSRPSLVQCPLVRVPGFACDTIRFVAGPVYGVSSMRAGRLG